MMTSECPWLLNMIIDFVLLRLELSSVPLGFKSTLDVLLYVCDVFEIIYMIIIFDPG